MPAAREINIPRPQGGSATYRFDGQGNPVRWNGQEWARVPPSAIGSDELSPLAGLTYDQVIAAQQFAGSGNVPTAQHAQQAVSALPAGGFDDPIQPRGPLQGGTTPDSGASGGLPPEVTAALGTLGLGGLEGQGTTPGTPATSPDSIPEGVAAQFGDGGSYVGAQGEGIPRYQEIANLLSAIMGSAYQGGLSSGGQPVEAPQPTGGGGLGATADNAPPPVDQFGNPLQGGSDTGPPVEAPRPDGTGATPTRTRTDGAPTTPQPGNPDPFGSGPYQYGVPGAWEQAARNLQSLFNTSGTGGTNAGLFGSAGGFGHTRPMINDYGAGAFGGAYGGGFGGIGGQFGGGLSGLLSDLATGNTEALQRPDNQQALQNLVDTLGQINGGGAGGTTGTGGDAGAGGTGTGGTTPRTPAQDLLDLARDFLIDPATGTAPGFQNPTVNQPGAGTAPGTSVPPSPSGPGSSSPGSGTGTSTDRYADIIQRFLEAQQALGGPPGGQPTGGLPPGIPPFTPGDTPSIEDILNAIQPDYGADRGSSIPPGGQQPGTGTGTAPPLVDTSRESDPVRDALANALGQDTADALTAANRANEERYNDILGGYVDREGQAIALSNFIGNRQLRDLYDLYGVPGSADGGQVGAKVDQDLLNRGLGNTTVRSSAQLGVQRNRDRASLDLADQIADQRLGILGQFTGDTLGFAERRTDAAPDPMQIAELLRGLGQAGPEGGTPGQFAAGTGGTGTGAPPPQTGAPSTARTSPVAVGPGGAPVQQQTGQQAQVSSISAARDGQPVAGGIPNLAALNGGGNLSNDMISGRMLGPGGAPPPGGGGIGGFAGGGAPMFRDPQTGQTFDVSGGAAQFGDLQQPFDALARQQSFDANDTTGGAPPQRTGGGFQVPASADPAPAPGPGSAVQQFIARHGRPPQSIEELRGTPSGSAPSASPRETPSGLPPVPTGGKPAAPDPRIFPPMGGAPAGFGITATPFGDTPGRRPPGLPPGAVPWNEGDPSPLPGQYGYVQNVGGQRYLVPGQSRGTDNHVSDDWLRSIGVGTGQTVPRGDRVLPPGVSPDVQPETPPSTGRNALGLFGPGAEQNALNAAISGRQLANGDPDQQRRLQARAGNTETARMESLLAQFNNQQGSGHSIGDRIDLGDGRYQEIVERPGGGLMRSEPRQTPPTGGDMPASVSGFAAAPNPGVSRTPPLTRRTAANDTAANRQADQTAISQGRSPTPGMAPTPGSLPGQPPLSQRQSLTASGGAPPGLSINQRAQQIENQRAGLTAGGQPFGVNPNPPASGTTPLIGGTPGWRMTPPPPAPDPRSSLPQNIRTAGVGMPTLGQNGTPLPPSLPPVQRPGQMTGPRFDNRGGIDFRGQPQAPPPQGGIMPGTGGGLYAQGTPRQYMDQFPDAVGPATPPPPQGGRPFGGGPLPADLPPGYGGPSPWGGPPQQQTPPAPPARRYASPPPPPPPPQTSPNPGNPNHEMYPQGGGSAMPRPSSYPGPTIPRPGGGVMPNPAADPPMGPNPFGGAKQLQERYELAARPRTPTINVGGRTIPDPRINPPIPYGGSRPGGGLSPAPGSGGPPTVRPNNTPSLPPMGMPSPGSTPPRPQMPQMPTSQMPGRSSYPTQPYVPPRTASQPPRRPTLPGQQSLY